MENYTTIASLIESCRPDESPLSSYGTSTTNVQILEHIINLSEIPSLYKIRNDPDSALPEGIDQMSYVNLPHALVAKFLTESFINSNPPMFAWNGKVNNYEGAWLRIVATPRLDSRTIQL